MIKPGAATRKSLRYRFKMDIKQNMCLYIMTFIGVAFIFIFNYLPVYGIQIAFKRYNVVDGIWGSPWVGLEYFKMFIEGPYFARTVLNTFALGLLSFFFGFWPPILLALLLNELTNKHFKKVVQSITYFPSFIATVIIVGMLMEFFSFDGIVNDFLALFGVKSIYFFSDPSYFRALYVGSGVWQGIGSGSIIYLASIAGINPELYECAYIEGANRFQRARYITFPSILPTVMILLIFSVTSFLSVNFEKVYLMYSPAIYETADVIATYTFRIGVENGNFSYGAAVGLLNQVVAMIFMVSANYLSKWKTDYSLW